MLASDGGKEDHTGKKSDLEGAGGAQQLLSGECAEVEGSGLSHVTSRTAFDSGAAATAPEPGYTPLFSIQSLGKCMVSLYKPQNPCLQVSTPSVPQGASAEMDADADGNDSL